MKQYTVDDVLFFLKEYSTKGTKENKFFTHTKPIELAEQNTVVWVSPTRKDKQILLDNTKAEIIICDNSLNFSETILREKCCIVVENPKLVFLRIVETFFTTKIEFSIHPTAIINQKATISENVYIGPNSYIGKCTIGNNTIIHGNCYLYDNITIGNNVVINAGTIIGADGFGYSKNNEGVYEKFPHIGGVVIEDNVEIGANTCVDKGTLGNTLIKKGAKIDNLVHIAHNVIIGENSFVIALSMIGGSTVIGDNVWVAPASSLRDGLVIGDNTVIGMGANITKSIPGNEVWIGNPGQKIK